MKEYQLETGTCTISEKAGAENAAKLSMAVSLKRIADALQKLADKPPPLKSILEDIFGTKL